MSWQLTARVGRMRGTSWRIGTRPLILGRSLSCDVTIADPTISRKHCEISLDQGTVRFRDLGSRNVSLVNGRVVVECCLQAGDEVTLGSESFIVTRMTAPEEPIDAPESEARLTTLSLGDAVYLGDDLDPAYPTSVGEVMQLYHFGRKLRIAHTPEEYATFCLQELEELFPARVTTAVCCAGSGPLRWYPTNFNPPHAVREHVLQTLDSGRASTKVVQEKYRLIKRLVNVAAAPLVLNARCQGVLVAVASARDYVLDDAALARLDAVAQVASPYLAALEYREDFSDSNTATTREVTPQFLGRSPSVEKLRAELELVGKRGLNTLVTGEAGTGKDLAAHIIHQHAEPPRGPLISTNCVIIAGPRFLRSLLGSELVAPDDRVELTPGLLDQSNGGTLLLREVDALTSANQLDLSRLLATGAFTRIGGYEEITYHGRIVATSSKDLDQLAAEGQFRMDLLRILARERIDIKPLRRRPSDIEALAQHFLKEGREHGEHQLEGLTSEALDFLRTLPLAGNALELRDTITRAGRQSRNAYLSTQDLAIAAGGKMPGSTRHDPLESAERALIQAVLGQCGDNVTEAAGILGIPEDELVTFLSSKRP